MSEMMVYNAAGRSLAQKESERIIEAAAKNPLSVAPSKLRHSVWQLWVIYSHMFPSPLPLAAMFRLWVENDGMEEDDAVKMVMQLITPECIREIKFASDLTTEMGRLAAEKINWRRKEAATIADRERAARETAEMATPEEMRAFYAQLAKDAEAAGLN